MEQTVRRGIAGLPGKSLQAAMSVLLLAAIPASQCQAQSDDWVDTVKGLHPYAAVTITDDSNLLRTSDAAAAALPQVLGEKSDRYLTLEAGLDTEIKASRQRFFIDGRIYQNLYDRFDQLDHVGGDAKVLWKWLYGKLWEGELGYKYIRKLRDLTNQELPAKDMLDRHKVHANAIRRLDARWRLGVGADWTDIESSIREGLAKRILGGRIALEYETKSGNTLGLEAKFADADYSNTPQRDYQTSYLGPTLDWRITPITRLSAEAGYLRRKHDSLGERDFEGLVGRLGIAWKTTDKLTVNASAWREISNLNDEIADYAEITGISLEPTWAITAKTQMRLSADYEQRDFTGSELLAPGEEERQDDVYALSLWLDWDFLRNGRLSLGYGVENRDSNRRLREYDYRFLQAKVSLGL